MNAETTRSVVVEREMAHPPEKIWRALTQGELIKEWLMENDFQPSVGRKFRLRAAPFGKWDGVIDCEVLVVEPNQQLSYTWTTLGLESVVAWTLTPTKTGTLVRIEQSGFRPDQEPNFKGARYGWNKFIGNLDRVVARL